MATKKSRPAAKPPTRSSFDRFARIGAIQGSTRSLPAFQPEELILPCDRQHPAYATHEAWRYAEENPEIQRDMRYIEAKEGKLLQSPTGSTLQGRDETLVFIKDGARRIAALRHLNRRRRREQEAEFKVHVEITFNETIESFMEAHTITNLRRVDDDPVTVAKKARQRLLGDDEQGIEPLAIPQVAEMFGVDEKYLGRILNERTGLLALSPRWQEAVSKGEVAEAAALSVAAVTKDEDKDAERYAAQDALLQKLDGAGRLAKATPTAVRALARGDAPAAAPAKPKTITAKERAALGRLLALLTPGWCADVGQLSPEAFADLRAKLPAPEAPAGGGT